MIILKVERNKVLEIPFSEEPALPSLDIVSMKRRKRARSQTITSGGTCD